MKTKHTFPFLVAIAVTIMSVTACGSMGTTAIRAYEVVDQTYRANAQGTYCGTASSYEGARQLAASKGFTRFEWYSSTGDVWGFNN